MQVADCIQTNVKTNSCLSIVHYYASHSNQLSPSGVFWHVTVNKMYVSWIHFYVLCLFASESLYMVASDVTQIILAIR